MKRAPPTGVVYERVEVVLSTEIKAWIADFTFYCNGIPYFLFFVIGKNDLTERQARDTMESKQYIREARQLFLEAVIIAPTIN